ncbi:integrase, catalytic region, zinc finger, CCHC-type containing protein [Tanacetum coccineum]
MGSHTLQQLKIYSFDELKELFETTMKNVNTFVSMETEDRGRASELVAGSSQATIIDFAKVGSSKRAAEAELDHEGSKRKKTNEASGSVQEQPEEELSQEDLQQMMMVVPVEEVYVEALQDMLKIFDRDDLVMLWNLVKERFSSTEPTDDKERALWVELKRCNRTLIKAARKMLIYAKASLFLWAEAVATACYTQNRSIIRLRHCKAPYELLHDKLPDLSFFHVFGALCYPTNNSENLEKLQPKADIDFDELTAMASEHSSLEPALHEITPAIITPEVIALVAEVVAPEPAKSTSSPSSTTVDQDAPLPSNSQTTPETQSLVIYNDVEEVNHDLDVAHMNNDPFFGIPIPENDSEVSSSSDVIPTIVHTAAPNSEHVTKWTKDYPLSNIIVKPKNYNDALTQACWIEAVQEELNEFECLEVWELVPRPDKVMVIILKWIYKVKLDELGGIQKNKARLVARGYR